MGVILSVSAQEVSFSLVWENQSAKSLQLAGDFPNLKIKVTGASNFMAGKCTVFNGQTTFLPYIPFTNGLTYQAYAQDRLLCSFTPSTGDQSVPTITAVYPKGRVLPENFLKFYIRFSEPMEVGKFYDYLHLYNQEGEEVDRAFIRLSPELWNETRTLLTLWIEPGRIKRDLGPNRQLGQVLEKGKTYRLIIDGGFRSKQGISLEENYEKIFEVGERDEQKPTVDRWEISPPTRNKQESLKIHFGEAMDYAMTQMLEISDGKELVKGDWVMESDEVINFTPEKPWKKGSYQLAVNANAEDLAGNNFLRLFDVDLLKTEVESVKESWSVKFEVR
ncbi:MAG: Ig-like domain-containing protein [Cyclobacteriaceae bacterium]